MDPEELLKKELDDLSMVSLGVRREEICSINKNEEFVQANMKRLCGIAVEFLMFRGEDLLNQKWDILVGV